MTSKLMCFVLCLSSTVNIINYVQVGGGGAGFLPGASPVPRSFDYGGLIQLRQIHLHSNSNFSSDLGHFISKILKNRKNGMLSEKMLKSSRFLGDVPLEFRTGGRVSPVPQAATPMIPAVDLDRVGGQPYPRRTSRCVTVHNEVSVK